jgi:hypothetical protein
MVYSTCLCTTQTYHHVPVLLATSMHGGGGSFVINIFFMFKLFDFFQNNYLIWFGISTFQTFKLKLGINKAFLAIS